MASIYDLKPKFQSLLRPLVTVLANKGVTANQVTLFAMILSFVCGGLVAFFPTEHILLLSIPLVLFIRMALNAIDGMLAREHDMKTPLGAILNELGDVFSDVALYLPLALIPGTHSIWLILVVILSIISEMTGVIAVQIGAQRKYEGPMGKSDRAFVFGCIGMIIGLGVSPQPWLEYLMIIMLVLLLITIINRSKKALSEVQ
jgi:CDP-diacylglycerol---glycerol-3-phosphate 3-phosphatidyltransferase